MYSVARGGSRRHNCANEPQLKNQDGCRAEKMLTSIDLGTPGFLWLVFHGIFDRDEQGGGGAGPISGAVWLSSLRPSSLWSGLSAGLSGEVGNFCLVVFHGSPTPRKKKKSCELRIGAGCVGRPVSILAPVALQSYSTRVRKQIRDQMSSWAER